MKRRIIHIAMTAILALFLAVPSLAIEPLYPNDDEIYSGKIIPAEVSDAAFSNKIDYASLADFEFTRELSISGDHISINLSLLFNASEVQLHYEGKIYKSSRYTDGKPVYIGVFENDSTTDFEVIYFEISNDSSPYNLDSELRNSASITMYLQSDDRTIYDLGSKIVSPIILDGINDQAPSDKDLNWFLNYFNGTYEEIQISSPNSTYRDTWYGNQHTLTFQIVDFVHTFLATPYIDFRYGDVPSYGTAEFGMSLKIIESHKYRLYTETTWTNDTNGTYDKCFTIDNVSLTWTAGGNTAISSVAPHLLMHNKNNITNFWGFAAAITGILPQTATLSQIISKANSIMNATATTSTEFTNTEYGGMLYSNTNSYKMVYPSNYYIAESSNPGSGPEAERFEYIARMVTYDSSLAKRQPTYAVAGFSFTLNWGSMYGHSGSKDYSGTQSFQYLNNC